MDVSDKVLLPELSNIIIGSFYYVYTDLGTGFLESVYKHALAIVLSEQGISCRVEYPITIRFHGIDVGRYRADLVVEDQIILECKACTALTPGHYAQVLHYLKATNLPLGILLNFGSKPSFKRLIRTSTRDNHKLRTANYVNEANDANDANLIVRHAEPPHDGEQQRK